MPKLIMTQGLPASGKTTFARQLKGYLVVNKDEIRKELVKGGWVWSRENEKQVVAIRDEYIINALAKGQNVISSDTNLTKKHENRLRQLAKQSGAEFWIESFLDVPIEECVRRDAKRNADVRVGKEVIQGMYDKYIKPTENEAIIPRAGGRPYIIICDLDGTLCHHEGLRGVYEHSLCAGDRLDPVIYEVITIFEEVGYEIVYLTGREEKYRPQTTEFLRMHNCPKGSLFMRPFGDRRPAAIVKKELFEKYISDPSLVAFALEDYKLIVDMWQSLGIPVLVLR